MTSTGSELAVPEGAARGGGWRLEVYGAVGLQLSVLLAVQQWVGLTVAGWVAAIGFLFALSLAVAAGPWRPVPARSADPSIGPANLITLARSLLVGAVIALVVSGFSGGWQEGQRALAVGLSVVAVILDGVDGRVARRTRTSSAFGARFDIEIDSVLALALAIGLARELTPLALVLGLARYLYLTGARIWPWLNLPLPTRLSRKIIGLLGTLTLIIATAGFGPPWVGVAVVAVGTAAVVFSFGRDIVAQFRLSQGADVM